MCRAMQLAKPTCPGLPWQPGWTRWPALIRQVTDTVLDVSQSKAGLQWLAVCAAVALLTKNGVSQQVIHIWVSL